MGGGVFKEPPGMEIPGSGRSKVKTVLVGVWIFSRTTQSIIRLKGAHNLQGITTRKARKIDLLLFSCNSRLFF